MGNGHAAAGFSAVRAPGLAAADGDAALVRAVFAGLALGLAALRAFFFLPAFFFFLADFFDPAAFFFFLATFFFTAFFLPAAFFYFFFFAALLDFFYAIFISF